MRAAVVTAFDRPPTCQNYPTPEPQSANEILVDVLASGLHPRVRSQAAGSHYTSTDELPLVPGIDGVGRDRDGILRYFVLPDTTMGAMAEHTVIDVRRSVVLPEGSDPVLVAAAMNPAMSAWVALRRRITFQPGSTVLILGATGSAGQMAVQVAKHLGASHVIGAGRNLERLAKLTTLGAEETIQIGELSPDLIDGLGHAVRGVDIVIDYIWGQPAIDALSALVISRTDPAQPLTWIQIGSLAGAVAGIPSATLRSTRLQIVGSGQGSVPTADIVAELSDLAAEITIGSFRIDAHTVPLADVEIAWQTDDHSQRTVITP